MFITRAIFETLKNELNKKKITAIIGSRQVGKTTLMKELVKLNEDKSFYLTFDDPEYLELFETNIKLFIEKYVKPFSFLYIDEFQYASHGGKFLKFIYDTCETKILISGSSSPDLTIHSLQYLVGRVTLIEVYPLSFEEFINFKDKTSLVLFDKIRNQEDMKILFNYFEEYLMFGGYPAVVKTLEKKNELKHLIRTYIMKEIKDVLSFKNIFEYEHLIKRLALQDGKLLNKFKVSQNVGIPRNKIEAMIQILEKTYVLTIIRPFFTNKIKEQIKSPKTYFHDLGFKNSLIDNFSDRFSRLDKGEIYENFILNQIIRSDKHVQFWNLQNRYEMDFVLQENGKLICFEVKSKLTNTNLTSSIKKFIEQHKPSIVYVFNENMDASVKYNSTKIVFTNHLNIINIMNSMI